MRLDRFKYGLAIAALAVLPSSSRVYNSDFSTITSVEASTSCQYVDLSTLKADPKLVHLKYDLQGKQIRFTPAFAFGINRSDYDIRNVLSTDKRVSMEFKRPGISEKGIAPSFILEADYSRDLGLKNSRAYMTILITDAYNRGALSVNNLNIRIEDLSEIKTRNVGDYKISTNPEGSTAIFLPKKDIRFRLTVLNNVDAFTIHSLFTFADNDVEYLKVVNEKVKSGNGLFLDGLRQLSQGDCKGEFPVFSSRFLGLPKG